MYSLCTLARTICIKYPFQDIFTTRLPTAPAGDDAPASRASGSGPELQRFLVQRERASRTTSTFQLNENT